MGLQVQLPNQISDLDGAFFLSVSAAVFAIFFFYKFMRKVNIPTINIASADEIADKEPNGPVHLDMPLKDPGRPGFIQCYDPSTSKRLGEIKAMNSDDVNAVVAKAAIAQRQWCQTSFSERKRVLQCMLKYILAHQEEICRVASRDSGKSMVDAMLGEVLTTCEKIRCTCEFGESWLKREKRSPGPLLPHKVAYVEYHPLGVLGVIAPWNYPFHNVFNHIISGIFSGNAVVSKVSEYTCWSSNYFSAIARSSLSVCGHNPDLCAIVTGFGEAGAALVSSPGIDQIIFTGSPEVGKKVMSGAANHLKPVVLELGGKDPMVVCEDANVKTVMPFAMRGVYQNSGQNCVGIERIYVYESIYSEFCSAAVDEVSKIRQGPPLSEYPYDCGAMVMPAQIDIIQSLVDDAVSSGARLLAGGRKNPNYPEGLFYEPTILADVTNDMRIAKTEVFGPVMSIIKVPKNDDQIAIKMVNESSFGLGSSVFSGDQDRGIKLGTAIRCGMTSVNDFAVYYMAQTLPFGGVKQSGFGKFAGPEGLRSCCLQKSVVVDKVGFIKTVIPTLLQYPISPGGMRFTVAMVNVIYDNSLIHKAKAVIEMIRAMKE